MSEKTTAERLDEIEEERKALKGKIKNEREERLINEAKMREDRDLKIENTQKKVNNILDKIYAYNKLGKVAKIECDILSIILKEISVIEVDENLEEIKETAVIPNNQLNNLEEEK